MGRPNSQDRARDYSVVLKVRKAGNRSVPVAGRRPMAKPVGFPCKGGCGYRVRYDGDYCGECLCEEDGL